MIKNLLNIPADDRHQLLSGCSLWQWSTGTVGNQGEDDLQFKVSIIFETLPEILVKHL